MPDKIKKKTVTRKKPVKKTPKVKKPPVKKIVRKTTKIKPSTTKRTTLSYDRFANYRNIPGADPIKINPDGSVSMMTRNGHTFSIGKRYGKQN